MSHDGSSKVRSIGGRQYITYDSDSVEDVNIYNSWLKIGLTMEDDTKEWSIVPIYLRAINIISTLQLIMLIPLYNHPVTL